jgi:hypothetical protein
MAVLQFIPDLPRSGEAGVELSSTHQPESNAGRDKSARIYSAVITPPRVPPSVLAPFLHFAAELALRSTGAEGCAIAMRAGAGFRCYSSVGDAPPVNAPVPLAGTLTGMCVRKGKTIRRDDMMDEAADDLNGYAGNARSILLAPIFQDGNVGGVIGIFAPEPHSFLNEHETALEQLASVVGIALLHPDRLQASSQMAEAFGGPAISQPAVPVYAPAPDTDRAAQALENLAQVLTTVLLNTQRPAPALPSETPAASESNGQPRKRLYGLPCGKCGAYFTSDQTSCSVCGTPRTGKR